MNCLLPHCEFRVRSSKVPLPPGPWVSRIFLVVELDRPHRDCTFRAAGTGPAFIVRSSSTAGRRARGVDARKVGSFFRMELARNLRRDPVSRLDPSPPWAVDRADTVADAVALMRRENVGGVLVCEVGRLVGLFTERDLMCRVLAVGKALDLSVADVMTPAPVTVLPSDPIRIAIRRMKAGGHRHLPVIDEESRPVGILSVKRVIHYLVEHYPAAVYNQPPPGQLPDSPEGA